MENEEKHTITRTGQPPIRFVGTLLGSSSSRTPDNNTRGTDVNIYATKGGKFVGEIYRWTCWQGETDDTKAKVFEDFGDLIEWLKEGSHDGTLGRIPQEAVENVIRKCPDLDEYWIEEVDKLFTHEPKNK